VNSGRTDEELITIEVVGPLTGVEFDGTLAYLTMCAPPDPRRTVRDLWHRRAGGR
jgi:hypothetical protein